MIKTEMMKKYEDYTGETLEDVEEREKTLAFLSKYTRWLEAKANISDETIEAFQEIIRTQCDEISTLKEKVEAYDRLMSGEVKMTMQEMANFIGRAITVNKEGGVTAHGSIPRIVNTWLGECWYNEADEYMEIPESFVDFSGDWKDSLTLPDGWEEK